jgi:flagellar motor switch protein FliM
MERVLWQSLKNFDEAWSKILEVSSTLEKVETSMQFAQIVDVNEPVLMVTLNITIGSESGLIGVGRPHHALEPFTKKLNTRHMYRGTSQKGSSGPSRSSSPSATDIVLAPCSIHGSPVGITSLAVGDVIQLQHRVDEPVIVKYQQVPKFRASLGKYRNSLALKILEEIKGEEDNE